MNTSEFITVIAAVGTSAAALGTCAAAIFAMLAYRRSVKLERAKWSLSLYEKFYEQPRLKEVREVLDSDSDGQEVISLVLKCSADFTDYLNFFEFVAFLERNKQLRRDEVRALFDYYIKCLKRHPRVIKFIEDNGYEDLRLLLGRWE